MYAKALIKKISIALAAPVMLSGCNNYDTAYEAQEACQKWAKEAGSYILGNSGSDMAGETGLRKCLPDSNQLILGLEVINTKAGKVHSYEGFKEELRVKKKFHY